MGIAHTATMSAAPPQSIAPPAQVDQDGVATVRTNCLQEPLDASRNHKSIDVTPVPDAVTVEVAAEPDGQVDCAGSYLASFRPFCCDILCNPIRHSFGDTRGLATLFKTCKPKDAEESMKLIGSWAVIKLWLTYISAFLMFCVLGLVIGGIATAIMNVILSLIIGFFFTHMIWWLATRMHGCCGPVGFLILGIACYVGALLHFISFCMGIDIISYFPSMAVVYLFELVLMVPAIYMGHILVQHYCSTKNQATSVGVASDGVDVQPAAGTMITVPQGSSGGQQLTVQTASGPVTCIVPQGMVPGNQFMIPAQQPAPAPAPVQQAPIQQQPAPIQEPPVPTAPDAPTPGSGFCQQCGAHKEGVFCGACGGS